MIEEVRTKIGLKIAGKGYRFAAGATLRDLTRASGSIETSAWKVLEELGDGGTQRLGSVYREFRLLTEELGRRESQYNRSFPSNYRIGADGAFLIYGLTRLTEPETVVETGVADGYSSFYILNALRLNGRGNLVSCDVSKNVGGILSDSETDRWRLELLDMTRPKESFSQMLERLPPIDIFIHDSDHSYRWQLFELESALPHLAKSGFIVCDDVDASYAFLDFVEHLGQITTMLVEHGRAVGVVHLSKQSRNDVTDSKGQED